MYDLARFGLREMIEAGKVLRGLGRGATSMEAAAREAVDFLYGRFCTPPAEGHPGGPQCALVRCFKTHPYASLPAALETLALGSLGSRVPGQSLHCLTLLATRGELPAWNSRHGSAGHQVIPLPTVEMVRKAPMIARLIVQMGLEIRDIVQPEANLVVDVDRRSFNVFHVEDARGSEFVPAQHSFVTPFGVRSVLGFGGLLPSGELFAVVMFTKVKVTRETAELFRTLALGVKLVLLPFAGGKVFEDE